MKTAMCNKDGQPTKVMANFAYRIEKSIRNFLKEHNCSPQEAHFAASVLTTSVSVAAARHRIDCALRSCESKK